MILVDTSAWVQYLRNTSSSTSIAVREALISDSATITDPVIMEVLAGARNDMHVRSLNGLLGRLRIVRCEPGDFLLAAEVYRASRAIGVTIRSQLDCVIAAIAMRNDLPLLQRDRDFLAIASTMPLQLV